MSSLRLPAILSCLIFISIPVFSQKLVIDNTFSPSLNGGVQFMETTTDQKLLIAGDFTTVNGQSRLKIARLNADGSLDTSFDANWIFTSSNLNEAKIEAMTFLPDGKIYVSASFANAAPNMPDKIFRLNSDGSLDQSLTTIPSFEGVSFLKVIRKVQPLSNGKFLACGYFSTANGNPKSRIARFNGDGSFDSTFTTEINNSCYDVALQPDGKYLIAGDFTTVNGITKVGLVRFNTDDSIDTSFAAFSVNNQFTLDIYKLIKLMDDETMYVFHEPEYNDNGLLLLKPDGSLKTRFLTYARPAKDIEVLPNGKILAVGDFATTNQAYGFNRFTPNGRHDGSVRIDFFNGNEPTKALEIMADNKIVVAGVFTSIRIDGVSTTKPYLVKLIQQPVPIKRKFDFDGDGRDDLAVFRLSDQVWYVNQSTNGFTSRQFGLSTDIPVAADYDLDGKADIAVFRDGVWYWMKSSDNTLAYGLTGQAGDIPQGGFNGRFYLRGQALSDGTPGLLTFRPSEAKFYLQNPYEQPHSVDLRGMPVTSNDIPVSADYDGDEKDDVAVFQNGQWYYLSSNDFRVWHYQFGSAGDKPVIGDFDADGRTDYAVFRPSNGVWYIQKSTEGFYAVQWGLADDLPVPADYDGDGRTEIAVYRDGIWYILNEDGSYNIGYFGLAGDIPAQLTR